MTVPDSLLLVQLYHLGDVMLTTPAIRAARRAFPKARIDFATRSLGAQALEGNPHLDHILIDPSFAHLRRAHYDAVIDMHSVPRSAPITWATRAHVRVGIRGSWPRNYAYTRLFEREPGHVYMALQKLRMLAPLGIDVAAADLRLEIAMDEGQRARAQQLLVSLQQPIVAISPVAKHEFKQWGALKWAAVADALAVQGASILITSGPGEEAQAEAVARAMKQPALWQYGRTSVRELAAIYAQCALWLGNDGGPKHLATAAGTPTITVNRRQLGRVWSDETDANQIQINSGTLTLDTISVADVVTSAAPRLRVNQ
jgi:heptosyltransferase III